MAQVFFSYSHDDEALRDQLEKHLASLRYEGAIESWHDRRILPGDNLDASIDVQIDSAELILLLVSSSFLSSRYCYTIEMQRALERHQRGECKVVPVILRACDWHNTPLGSLMAVPRDGKPITSWTNPDEAYTDVVRQIRALLQHMQPRAASRPPSAPAFHVSPDQPQAITAGEFTTIDRPRSSNLRLRKTFSDFDKDQFAHEGFDYIRRFFENSLAELQQRNPGIQGTLRGLGDTGFSASICREGRVVSECSIAIGADFGRNSITYSSSVTGGGYNEMLSIGVDDQDIFFQSLMGGHRAGSSSKLSAEGAAELLWGMLLAPLQR